MKLALLSSLSVALPLWRPLLALAQVQMPASPPAGTSERGSSDDAPYAPPPSPLTPAPARPLPAPPSRLEEVDPSDSDDDPLAPRVTPARDPKTDVRPQENEGEAPGQIVWQPSMDLVARGELRLQPFTRAVAGNDPRFFLTSRVRPGLAAQKDWLRALVQLEDVRFFGQAGPEDGALIGLHQGYAEAALDKGGFLRVGRQEIAYGTERLIGTRDWLMRGQAFDAVRLHLTSSHAALEWDLAGAVLEAQGPLSDNVNAVTTDDGDYLATSMLTWRVVPLLTLSPYVLFRHDGPTEDVPDFNQNIVSPGILLQGEEERWSYDLETTVQFGNDPRDGRPDNRHFAAMTAGSGSLTANLSPKATLRTTIGGSYATGDGDEVDEFNIFYASRHKFQGNMDLFALQNIIEGYVRSTLIQSKWTLFIAGHLFGLANPGARWSNSGEVTVGIDPENDSRFTGAEVDFQGSFTLAPEVELQGGYSIFVPGPAADALSTGKVQQWMYVMASLQLPPPN